MFLPVSRFTRSTTLKYWSLRLYSQQNSQTTRTPAVNSNVDGLSDKCVDVPSQPVGPGAAKNKEYKNPEYFCYHVDSFGESMVELSKYRLPVPSNKRKFGN